MMPKGVEHRKPDELLFLQLLVRIPMMPKGVEHPKVLVADDSPDIL